MVTENGAVVGEKKGVYKEGGLSVGGGKRWGVF